MPTATRSLAPASAAFAAALATLLLASPLMSQATPTPPPASSAPPSAVPDDPYLWLENVEGDSALAWVRERNTRSLGVLQGDPRYATLHAQALEIVNATDRIASPGFAGTGDEIRNFWQDASHVRGLYRRTTLTSYQSESPSWTAILDVDALARAEGKNWVLAGLNCLAPTDRYCLVSLSDGGKDAVTVREYDTEARRFVDGGFALPEGKVGVTWVDRNTLIVGREWVPGEVTSSGYPMVLKRVTRGQPLEAAQEIFRGQPTDVSVGAFTLRNPDGVVRALLVSRGVTFWESEIHSVGRTATVRLPFPARVNINGLLGEDVLFTTQQDWNGFKAGDLLAYDVQTLITTPESAKPTLVLRPGPREAIEGITLTRNRLVVALYENVRGAVYAYARSGDTWQRTRLPLPENISVGIGSASEHNDQLFVTVTGFLTPPTLYLADAAAGTATVVKAQPAKFDASDLEVTQEEATSADGTKVPYFIVRKKGAPRDGSTPTLLYGYGGFQISMLPSYSGLRGKLWLERGGAYAVANGRGGGEFGPQWHQTAIRENRHRSHDDFTAVAQDLIAKRYTSPRRLGIMGGSQGGLFVGVQLTKHPELFNAVVIAVPLFDMLRYHKLPPGASWMAEYGDPEIPEQRAWIAEYSPYQALAPGRPYPLPFIYTSTKDDRVHPGHARKAAARLEQYGYPYLYYENTDGGHAGAANLLETARRETLTYVYLTRQLMDAGSTP